MTHFSEDPQRDAIALNCIQGIQKFRNATTEFILVCNGHYDGLEQYADQYFERVPADDSPGRSTNIGVRAAKGKYIFWLCNDSYLFGNCIEECKKILDENPGKYLVTPMWPKIRKRHELPPVNGYAVNQRLGSAALMLTREQVDDIGPLSEVDPGHDGSELIDRWIDKGYAVMLTKEQYAEDKDPVHHSYTKKYKKYRRRH